MKYRASIDPEIEYDSNILVQEVLGDEALYKMFSNKLISKEFNWRTVEYVQACVKDSFGVGKPFNYHFFAPLDQSCKHASQQPINYQLEHDIDEYKCLQNEKYRDYMHK